jgi:hypothetical protein
MDFYTTESLSVIFDQACVIFDTNNGEVLHIHEVTALEGGYVPTETDLREQSLELAKLSGDLSSKEVAVVIVEPGTVAGEGPFRVDLVSNQVIAG